MITKPLTSYNKKLFIAQKKVNHTITSSDDNKTINITTITIIKIPPSFCYNHVGLSDYYIPMICDGADWKHRIGADWPKIDTPRWLSGIARTLQVWWPWFDSGETPFTERVSKALNHKKLEFWGWGGGVVHRGALWETTPGSIDGSIPDIAQRLHPDYRHRAVPSSPPHEKKTGLKRWRRRTRCCSGGLCREGDQRAWVPLWGWWRAREVVIKWRVPPQVLKIAELRSSIFSLTTFGTT